MKLTRTMLVTYMLLGLIAGGLIAGQRMIDTDAAPRGQAAGDVFNVTCRDILIGEMAADQSCWVANRPAQLIGVVGACDTAASNVAAAQLTHDEVVALTPEAAGAGADLLGRVRATVTPTGLFLSDPAGLPQFYRPQDRSTSDGSVPTVVPGFVGIFDPTAVAGGETFFKPGDRLSVDFSAVPTAAAGCTITAEFVGR